MNSDLLQFLIGIHFKRHIVPELNGIHTKSGRSIDEVMRGHYVLWFSEWSGTAGKTICERTDTCFVCNSHWHAP